MPEFLVQFEMDMFLVEGCKYVVTFFLSLKFFSLAGQPKRHLLTTGWSVFVSAKRLVAGDSVLFIWQVILLCPAFQSGHFLCSRPH